jgi:predicted transcriptional regulator
MVFYGSLDHKSSRASRVYLEMLSNMLLGKLPTHQPPSWNGPDELIRWQQALFELYQSEGAKGVYQLLTDMVQARRAYEREVIAEQAAEKASALRVYTVDELRDQQPVRFLDADRTLQENGVTMLVGQPGTGKSLWMLRKLDEIAQDAPVLLVAAEAQGGLPDRIKALESVLGRPMPSQLHIIQQPLNLGRSADVDLLIARATAFQPTVIAFDTWAACTAGVDENTVGDVTRVFDSVAQIRAKLACAILFIHHTRKDGTVYRGSSAIHGWVDNMFALTAEDERIVCRAVKTRNTSHPKAAAFQLVEVETRRDAETGEPVHAPALVPVAAGEGGTVGMSLTMQQRQILEALDGVESLGANAIEAATGLSTGTVGRVLRNLLQRGWVAQETARSPYSLTESGWVLLENVDDVPEF